MQDERVRAQNLGKPLFRVSWFWLVAVGAVCLVGGAYSLQVQEDLKISDRQIIKDNLYIQNLEALHQLVRDPRQALHVPDSLPYHPVLSFSFALDYWVMGGFDPWAYRLTQVLLMGILGIGLFAWYLFLVNRANEHWTNRVAALFAAMLFCVHLSNGEIVGDLSSRSTLLGTGGIVGSFLMYGYLPSWRPSHLYLLPMVVGTLAHPMAVLFAPLFLVYGLLFEKRLSCRECFARRAWPKVKHAFGKTLPSFLTGIGLLLFLDSMAPIQTSGTGIRAESLILQQAWWLHSILRFVFPFESQADWFVEAPSQWLDVRIFAGLLCVFVLGGMMWVSSAIKELRPVALGIIWFFLGVLSAGSRTVDGEWAIQPEILCAFMGLIVAMMSWLGYRVQTMKSRTRGMYSVRMGMLCVCLGLVLALHTIETAQCSTKSSSIPIPEEVSGVETSHLPS